MIPKECWFYWLNSKKYSQINLLSFTHFNMICLIHVTFFLNTISQFVCVNMMLSAWILFILACGWKYLIWWTIFQSSLIKQDGTDDFILWHQPYFIWVSAEASIHIFISHFRFFLIILYKVSPLNAHVCFLMFNFSLKFVIKPLIYMDLSIVDLSKCRCYWLELRKIHPLKPIICLPDTHAHKDELKPGCGNSNNSEKDRQEREK